MKHLSIVIEQFGIDRSEYSGNSVDELYDFVERKLANLTISPVLNLDEELSHSFSKISTAYILAQAPKANSIITDLPEGQKLAFLSEMRNYFGDADLFNVEPFRRIFLEDDGEGNIEAMSTPWECMHSTTTDEVRKAYGHMKFNQISKFIDEKNH